MKIMRIIKRIVIWGIMLGVIYTVNNLNVHASGGEEMEGSQLEKFLLEENQKEDDSCKSDMEYILFCETNTGYGVSLNYYRYGIYADFLETEKEGEALYFELNKQFFGKPLSIATYDEGTKNFEGLSPEWITHKKWAENEEEIIVDVSSDLRWIVTREYEPNCSGMYTERWYCDTELIKEFEGGTSYTVKQFEQQKDMVGNYEPISEENMQSIEEILYQFYGKYFCENYNEWTCFDSYGKLLAIVENDQDGCGIGINIYGIEEKDVKLLHHINNLNFKNKWPMEISQIEGDEKNGWLVFSYGDETYRMTYPNGDMKKIGEFMYGTIYSPDGKYVAYCTGNKFLFNFWEISSSPLFWDIRKRWDEVLPGWYIENIETGEKEYFEMPVWEYDVDRPIYGGRCVWIEKGKLKNLLGL